MTERYGKPQVPLDAFKQCLDEFAIIASSMASRIYFVEIARPAGNLINNCGDFSPMVALYNEAIKQKFGSHFVPAFGGCLSDPYVLPDGHHLNCEGHKLIAESLIATFGTNNPLIL